MGTARTSVWAFAAAFFCVALMAGCDSVPAVGEFIDVALDENGDVEALELEVVATNTAGASGIALRQSDGALFLVNRSGLFGPIEAGDDVSQLEPYGATNLDAPDIFDMEQNSLVLAITNSGEFWIGSSCCVTLAVVPPEGGDAEPFLGLLQGPDEGDSANIKASTMVIVPDGFDGPQIDPGNLLVGEDTTFSRLAAIDVEGDRTVVPKVDNPDELESPDDFLGREANHLAFAPDGTLYSSDDLPATLDAGLQTIDPDGRPHELPGTEGFSGISFVVLDNDDIIVRGSYRPLVGPRILGLLLWEPDGQTITAGVSMPDSELSADDELIMADDGTIYAAFPERNEVMRVIDNR